jgi:hypothetical protein
MIMNQFNAKNAIFTSSIFFALIASAGANAEVDPKCYHIHNAVKPNGGTYQVTDKKSINIDIRFSNPIPSGGTVIFDFSNSTVPSGQMRTSAPVLHPDFKATSSSAHAYSYTAPDRAADFTGKFVVFDTYCGFSESITLTLPVRL